MSNTIRQSHAGVEQSAVGLIERIGRTPLIRLPAISAELGRISIYGKAEWYNPGGSVKDRAAYRMIVEAEATGALQRGRTILDATSGNTGIAYAWIGVAKGYPVRLVVPDSASRERKDLLRAYGADVVYSDPLLGMDGAVAMAREIFAGDRESYFYPDQYQNPANWRAHYDGTAVEIWKQTRGFVTHFVAGLGTSGTFVGTTRRLKMLNPAVQCVSVEPDSPFHGLEGLKHMASCERPGIYDAGLADLRLEVRTEHAYQMTRRLVREEGLLVGPSSGAAVAGAVELARQLPAKEPAHVVCVLCDSGQRYMSERFWQ